MNPSSLMSQDNSSVNVKSFAVDIQNLKHVYPSRRLSRKAKQQQVPTDSITAVKNLSLQVQEAQIFGILGPNGSGKSTLFQILSTLLTPTSGNVRVCGFDVQTQSQHVRQQLGVVFQSPSLDDKLTAMENLIYHGQLYGLSGNDLKKQAVDALATVNLIDRANDFIDSFSGGMKRRVEIAKAMLHQPRILLLDEPSTGLDPAARRDIWQHLCMLREDMGITVLLTTHLMDEAEKCDQLGIMHLGDLVAVDTPDHLKQQIGGDVIQIDPHHANSISSLQSALAQMYPDKPLSLIDGKLLLEIENGPTHVAQIGSALGDQIKRISVGQPTLEDVFMHLTGHRLGDA